MHPTPGTLDRRVLNQTTFWVTASADAVRLSSMTRDHLVAVLDFLHEYHATRLHLEAMIDTLVDLVDANRAGIPSGEELAHYLTGRSIASLEPHQWLESTDLVRAIRRELATRH